MYMAIAIILGIAWLLGVTVFQMTAIAFHLVVVAAVVSLVLHFIWGGRRSLS